MGAAGSPYAAFQRAVTARNLLRARTEARELPHLSLADAAELVILAAEQDSRAFDHWAARWAGRYSLEEPGVTVAEAQLVLAALAGLRNDDKGASALALLALFKARNRRDLERPFMRRLGATRRSTPA